MQRKEKGKEKRNRLHQEESEKAARITQSTRANNMANAVATRANIKMSPVGR